MHSVNNPNSQWLHTPVLKRECLEYLRVTPGGTYVDLTFGEGGHSGALLESGAGRVVAFDRDLGAIERYRDHGPHRGDPRLELIHAPFSELGAYFSSPTFDGALVDLGVSTRQILSQERGFSFQGEGPLDMRMDPSRDRPLSQWLDHLSADELADALYRNTDLKGSRGVARRILEAHHSGQLRTTSDLASLFGKGPGRVHGATVVFLGLRMLVNDEMGEWERAVEGLLGALKPGGRVVAISFHSTEDRAVKQAFKRLAGACVCRMTPCHCPRERRVELVLKKPLEPGHDELRENPRSRSAKLRCIELLA